MNIISIKEIIMAIIIEDSHVESLARQIAVDEGVSVDNVLRESLLSWANLRRMSTEKAPLRERLESLAKEVDAIPPRTPADTRSDDEVLGYNEQGLW